MYMYSHAMMLIKPKLQDQIFAQGPEKIPSVAVFIILTIVLKEGPKAVIKLKSHKICI